MLYILHISIGFSPKVVSQFIAWYRYIDIYKVCVCMCAHEKHIAYVNFSWEKQQKYWEKNIYSLWGINQINQFAFLVRFFCFLFCGSLFLSAYALPWLHSSELNFEETDSSVTKPSVPKTTKMQPTTAIQHMPHKHIHMNIEHAHKSLCSIGSWRNPRQITHTAWSFYG